jgi:hypothetical protein
MPSTIGEKTPNAIFLNDPEAHKLHLEFEVATGQSVQFGGPVVLNTNGTIQNAPAGVARNLNLGYAIQSGAAGERVTVAVRGYAVVRGIAAADGQTAGSVEAGAVSTDPARRTYAAVTGASPEAQNTRAVGFQLTATADTGDEIDVCVL